MTRDGEPRGRSTGEGRSGSPDSGRAPGTVGSPPVRQGPGRRWVWGVQVTTQGAGLNCSVSGGPQDGHTSRESSGATGGWGQPGFLGGHPPWAPGIRPTCSPSPAGLWTHPQGTCHLQPRPPPKRPPSLLQWAPPMPGRGRPSGETDPTRADDLTRAGSSGHGDLTRENQSAARLGGQWLR